MFSRFMPTAIGPEVLWGTAMAWRGSSDLDYRIARHLQDEEINQQEKRLTTSVQREPPAAGRPARAH
jgi:hypothetical protein